MATLSLYNKWRPRTFADPEDHPLIGQEHVTRTLRNAVAGGQIAHAYLFCGPRGTGKTSAARILARAVNCRRGLRGEPCQACENCQALLSGRQLDLLVEIDGASNRGVDDVRQLRERIMQRPGGAELTGRFKVYIIDEVHMLTPEAFNALLKSLEEPPPHVIFVLATTDPQKVPATVASRCQRFDFKPVSLEVLVGHLTHVAATEGVRLEPAGVELLARAAAGGVRDAVCLLDQALAYTGAASRSIHGPGAGESSIAAAQVQAMLGLTDFEAVCRLVDSVIARDLSGALRLIQEVASQGADLRQFTRQVLEFLRTLMLARSDAASLLRLDETTQDAAAERSRRFSLAELVRLIKLFSVAEQGLKTPAVQPQLPLELAVVEASLDPPATAPAAGASAVAASLDPAPVSAFIAAAGPASAAPAAAVAQAAHADPATGEEAGLPAPVAVSGPHDGRPGEYMAYALPADAELLDAPPVGASSDTLRDQPARAVAQSAPAAPPPLVAPRPQVTLEAVGQQWGAVLKLVRNATHTVEALLRDATPIDVEDGNVVVLQFRYAFHRARVEDGPNQIAVNKALSRTLGVQCRVRCVVADAAGSKLGQQRTAAPQEDRVVAKALRIWRAHILTPPELAAVEALPLASAVQLQD